MPYVGIRLSKDGIGDALLGKRVGEWGTMHVKFVPQIGSAVEGPYGV